MPEKGTKKMSEQSNTGLRNRGGAGGRRGRSGGLRFAGAVAAHVYGVTQDELMATTRRARRAAEARQAAMYLGHVVFGVTLAEVGRAFHRDRSTASYACRRVEDRRENPEYDRMIAWMEVLLRSAGTPGDGPGETTGGAAEVRQ